MELGAEDDQRGRCSSPDLGQGVGIQRLTQDTSEIDDLYAAQLPSNSERGLASDIAQPEPEVAVRQRRLGSGKTGRVNKPGAGRPGGSYGGSVLRARSAANVEEDAIQPVEPQPGSVQYAQMHRSLKAGSATP